MVGIFCEKLKGVENGGELNMADGFSLELEGYCSFCGDFEPDIEKVDVTTFECSVHSYATTIKCRSAYKCARICENMRNRK